MCCMVVANEEDDQPAADTLRELGVGQACRTYKPELLLSDNLLASFHEVISQSLSRKCEVNLIPWT